MSSESILKIYPELDSVAFPLLLQTLFKTLSLVQTFSDLHHGLYSSVMVYLHLFLIQCQSEVTKMSVKLFHFFVQTFFYLTYKAHMLYHLPFHLYSHSQLISSSSFSFCSKSKVAFAAAAAAKSLQSCPTLCDPRDHSQPGSPVPGILQARTLEWVAISFSNA